MGPMRKYINTYVYKEQPGYRSFVNKKLLTRQTYEQRPA